MAVGVFSNYEGERQSKQRPHPPTRSFADVTVRAHNGPDGRTPAWPLERVRQDIPSPVGGYAEPFFYGKAPAGTGCQRDSQNGSRRCPGHVA